MSVGDGYPAGLQVSFFFFNATATTEIYTLSLHDALPISAGTSAAVSPSTSRVISNRAASVRMRRRSEEHTSELQSRLHLVCRLLLEKKKNRLGPVTHTAASTSIKTTSRISTHGARPLCCP